MLALSPSPVVAICQSISLYLVLSDATRLMWGMAPKRSKIYFTDLKIYIIIGKAYHYEALDIYASKTTERLLLQSYHSFLSHFLAYCKSKNIFMAFNLKNEDFFNNFSEGFDFVNYFDKQALKRLLFTLMLQVSSKCILSYINGASDGVAFFSSSVLLFWPQQKSNT